MRTGFGTNNVDHCTRLCHASSVAALLETIGSGAVSNQVADGTRAEVIIVIGARPNDNHPVAATFMKNAAENGSKLIVIEPYSSEMYLHAHAFLQLRPGTDVLLLNGMMHTIINEGLHDPSFIDAHTEGFAALRETVQGYSPEKVAPVCGIAAETIRETARLYATAETAIIFWGMGISQHVHGTDNARCLISLALMTGQIGRPGTGLHPLRGQNNVQGASDMGLIPMVYPDYQPVNDPKTRRKFEEFWGTELDPETGRTVVEIMHGVHAREITGMYIMGENPAMSDPNLHHAREALTRLQHLVVQDIFFTETCGFADVILPASAFPEENRHLYQYRPARATGQAGSHPARGVPSGPVDHPGTGPASRPGLELSGAGNGIRGDPAGRTQYGGYDLGAPGGDRFAHLSVAGGGRPGRTGHIQGRRLPDG